MSENITQQQMDSLGTNLIEGKDPVVRDNSNQVVETLPAETAGEEKRYIERWTDGDVSSSYYLPKVTAYKNGPSAFIVYSLDGLMEIDTILLAHHQNVLYATGEYKVYVSDKMDDLFAGYNEVASYNNQTDAATAQILHFQGEKPRGSLVGFQILKQTTDPEKEDSIRFRELGVYGNAYVPKEANLLAGLPVDAYLTDASGNRQLLDDAQFTLQQRKNLTNGQYTGLEDDAVILDTQGKRLDIVYNLCRNMTIDEIRLFSSQNAAYYVGEFKIYAAMTLEDVWKEENEAGHYQAPSSGLEAMGTFSFQEPALTARFIRFSILVPGDGQLCHLGELEALGLDNQLARNGNMLAGLPDENVTAYYEDRSTYKRTTLQSFPQKPDRYAVSNILDGVSNTLLDLYGGRRGEETMDILFYFGGLKAIHSIEYTGHPEALEYNAREIRYYIGETEEEVFGKDASPVAVFQDPDGIQGEHTVEFVPVVGRYLRVSIVTGCDDKRALGSQDVTVITDIAAMGFPVEGYSAAGDETIVSSFTDPDTGIRVDILKLDAGDVYTKATRMKLEFQPLNQEQKDLLSSMGMTSYGDPFTVSFYGDDGQQLASLGGRSIRVYIPLPPDDEAFYFGKVWPEEVAAVDAEMRGNSLVYLDSDLRSMTYALLYFGADNPGELLEIEDSPATGSRLPAAPIILAVLSLPVVILGKRRAARSGRGSTTHG